ncbi:hypothetical protein [Priestia megaterium]|nr:hypothetical protein [Priestia megaterium]MCM3303590.1 hypothetical protein [Priestia megaterium]
MSMETKKQTQHLAWSSGLEIATFCRAALASRSAAAWPAHYFYTVV